MTIRWGSAVAGLVLGVGLVVGCGRAGSPEGDLPEAKPITIEESSKIQKKAESDLGRMLDPSKSKGARPGAGPKPKAR
jgi:hypothetical protein